MLVKGGPLSECGTQQCRGAGWTDLYRDACLVAGPVRRADGRLRRCRLLCVRPRRGPALPRLGLAPPRPAAQRLRQTLRPIVLPDHLIVTRWLALAYRCLPNGQSTSTATDSRANPAHPVQSPGSDPQDSTATPATREDRTDRTSSTPASGTLTHTTFSWWSGRFAAWTARETRRSSGILSAFPASVDLSLSVLAALDALPDCL